MTEKRSIVKLTEEERDRLEGMLKKGKHSAAVLTKIRILLKADADHPEGGWTDAAICEALSRNKTRPEEVRKIFILEGLERILTRKQREMPAIAPTCDGEAEARLIQLACSQPPEGRARWTLQFRAEEVVELKLVDAASDSTVYRTLTKTLVHPVSQNSGLSRPRKTRPS